jgi:hypothetical protein
MQLKMLEMQLNSCIPVIQLQYLQHNVEMQLRCFSSCCAPNNCCATIAAKLLIVAEDGCFLCNDARQ